MPVNTGGHRPGIAPVSSTNTFRMCSNLLLNLICCVDPPQRTEAVRRWQQPPLIPFLLSEYEGVIVEAAQRHDWSQSNCLLTCWHASSTSVRVPLGAGTGKEFGGVLVEVVGPIDSDCQ